MSANLSKETTRNNVYGFKEYKMVDIKSISGELVTREKYYYKDFGYKVDLERLVLKVLEQESPLSEELFLRRIAYLWDRNRITNVVRDGFDWSMTKVSSSQVIRKDGFLYLKDYPIEFRIAGDQRRIEEIAPVELALGMEKIISVNSQINKENLFRTIANLQGYTHIGSTMRRCFEEALRLYLRINYDSTQ